jgi:hypothetical protein
MSGMSLAEVLEYGPIGAVDEDTLCMVTRNGSYLNFWVPVSGRCGSEWENTDAKCVNGEDMYKISAADFWDCCKEALELWQNPESDEE